MAELNPRRLTRAQLARVCGNDPELIKAFEALFAVTGSNIDDAEGAQLIADSTAAQQAALVSQLQSIASTLEVLALAPASVPLQAPEQHECPTCAATREELAALARRVADLESAP
jgi:hypothetical protein